MEDPKRQPSSKSSKATLHCPKGHPVVKLKEKLLPHEGHVHTYICNGCSRKLDRSEPRWKCENNCKFNVCQTCFDEQQRSGILPSVSRRDVLADSEDLPIMCPNGHQVVKLKEGGLKMHQGHVHVRTCQVCARKLTRDEPHWRCEHHCKFNVCPDCYEENQQSGDLSTAEGAKRAQRRSEMSIPMCNGFPMIEELEAIRVSNENVAPFSMSREAFDYVQKEFVVTFPNGDKERKIHCNTELTQQEISSLKTLQRQARSQQKTYFPSVSVAATRFLSTARGDIKKTVAMMDAAQQWRKEFFAKGPITDESVAEDFQHGIIYFAGRDSAYRPTIVVRANRIPDAWYKEKSADRLLRILIFSVEYLVRYMCIPGSIESNCLVVDLNGLAATQVPFKELKEIYGIMSHFYPGRLSRIYVCNLSTMLSMGMSAAKALLTDRQKQKIVYIKDVSQFLTDFAGHQLEQDLGGTRPIIKSFFPFPIAAGPYQPSSSGPDERAVKNLHEVFSPAGIQGRLWDPRQSEKQNTFIEYAENAVEIFERLGLPVPEDALHPPKFEANLGNAGMDEEDNEGDYDAAEGSEAKEGICKRCCTWCKGVLGLKSEAQYEKLEPAAVRLVPAAT